VSAALPAERPGKRAPARLEETLHGRLTEVWDESETREALRWSLAREKAENEELLELAEWMEVEGEEALLCFQFRSTHRLWIRSTNGVERLHHEIKRRSLVVRIFPNPESCRRLAAALLKEHHENWITGRRYIDMSRRRDEHLGPPEEGEIAPPAA
jgi:putative transposase